MVQVSETIPLTADKRIDQDAFLVLVQSRYPAEFTEQFSTLLSDLKQFAEDKTFHELPVADFALEMAAALYELNADPEALLACLFFPFITLKLANDEKRRKMVPREIFNIAQGVENMQATRVLLNLQDSLSQVDRMRKMLLAMINDVRVVLVKLAERLVLMRHLYEQSDVEQPLIAQGVMQLYAPLANRLGIGQLKWELEDRSFRALHDDQYRAITKNLDERRIDRENYVHDLIETLTSQLKGMGIESEISGRVKHIYSISKKMEKKHLSFDGLFDIQALRILVNDVDSCYRALSLVHEDYQSLPNEFDDYIATPKPNGYRSIHTVVKGPNDKNVEIQIRTFEMHEESEMGVAAHWRYKEGTNRDASYENRISWLRNLLDWQRELGAEDESIEALRTKVVDDRVYVFTPQGKVLDLPRGATPLDFAYQIHSDLGHRCRGAKIHGSIVPLTTPLNTGDEVELMTSNDIRPSRDWLLERSGYIKTAKARSKVSAWFRLQNKEENAAIGKDRLIKECAKAHIQKIDYDKLMGRFNHVHLDDFLAAIATGDVRLQTVMTVLKGDNVLPPETLTKEFKPGQLRRSKSDFVIEGVDNALIAPAGCCQPIMGDEIVGYVTQGKGVKVHREDCAQFAMVRVNNPERVLPVQWAQEIKGKYPLTLVLFGQNRTSLLRDITAVVSNYEVAILGMTTQMDKHKANVTVQLTVEVPTRALIDKLADQLNTIAGVVSVTRR